jgi:hypothetical protein
MAVMARIISTLCLAAGNRRQRVIVGQHGDHHIAVGDRGGNIFHYGRTRRAEIFGLRRRAVIDDEIVAGIEHITRHALPHAAEADKTNLHVTFLRLGLAPAS